MKLSNLSNVINNNAERKAIDKRFFISGQFHKIDTRLGNTSKDHLVQVTSDTLKTYLVNIHSFENIRISDSIWKAALPPKCLKTATIISQRNYVRSVELIWNILHYNCPHEAVCGTPCCHVFHVASKFNE